MNRLIVPLSLILAVASAASAEELGANKPTSRTTYARFWSASISEAIVKCQSDSACRTLNDLPEAVRPALKLFCEHREIPAKPTRAEKQRMGFEQRVCDAVTLGSNTLIIDKGELGLLATAEEITVSPYCGGFGVTAPLFSLRPHANQGQWKTDVSGPIVAGLGAGYFFPFRGGCRADWTLGATAFGFSEGLDPAKTFQLGVALGLQVNVFKVAHLGLATGYDLFRRVHVSDDTGTTVARENGLLSFSRLGHPSLSFMLTFSVQTGTTSIGE